MSSLTRRRQIFLAGLVACIFATVGGGRFIGGCRESIGCGVVFEITP